MKQLFIFFALFCSVIVHSQVKEGRVVYERTFQLPTRLLERNPEMAAQLPKSRTDQFELLFGNNQSLWQFLPDASSEGDPNTFTNGNVVLRFAAPGSNDISYRNFDKGIQIDQRELADKNYIVTDSIRKLDWKLSEETKTILNYTARKATAQQISPSNRMIMENGEMKRQAVMDTSAVVAWFTTDVPVSAGPSFYQGQLPGLILELDENNGRTVYKAVEVSPRVNLNKIKEPKDGKKMTAAEFDKERERVLEEMRKNMPNGMRVQIQN